MDTTHEDQEDAESPVIELPKEPVPERDNRPALAPASSPFLLGKRSRLSPQLRRELVGQLPVLSYPKSSSVAELQIRGDLGQVLDLDAEAFLRPLEALAEMKRPR